MNDEIVHRFQERIRDGPTVDYRQVPPIRPGPKLISADVDEVEVTLGFQLPPLLRALYTEVGDGGFGPGRGLMRLADGDYSLAAEARRTCVEAEGTGGSWWPPMLVPFVSWGCHYLSCVDCYGPPYSVRFYNHDLNIGSAKAKDYLLPQATSLEGWLTAWLDGVDLWSTIRLGRIPD